jgi:arylsulfatase A-like enzyme
MLRSPYGDEATLDFARAAIEGESLGRNPAGATDLLGISLSTHDYINHSFGPESRVSHDHVLRVDRLLADFFNYLDRRVGADKYVVALTSDHGFMNAPEYSNLIGVTAERLNSGTLMKELNAALAKRFKVEGNLAAKFSFPTIILDQALIAKSTLNKTEVEMAAQSFLQSYSSVAAVFTRTQLEAGTLPDNAYKTPVVRSWNKDLSGDLYVIFQPGNMMGSNAATHGSPWNYDTNVPVMLYGKSWIKPGKRAERALVADIAPTLSWLLEIRMPNGNEGRVLVESLK